MSQENPKVAVNLYGILDKELDRLHTLLNQQIERESRDSTSDYFSQRPHKRAPLSATEIYVRINTIQDIIVQSVLSTDKDLQERIAELALTGKDDGHQR